MAKAMIILTDGEDGNVDCRIEFDPPASAHGAMSPAQAHAMQMLEHSMKVADVVAEPVVTMRENGKAKRARRRR